jgi:hypothetical protein
MENKTVIILLLSVMMLAVLFNNCSIPSPIQNLKHKSTDGQN